SGAVVKIKSALRPRHDDVPLAQILLVERKEAAHARTVVVDEALGVAVGVVVGGTLEHDLAARAASGAGAAAAVELGDDPLLAERDEESPADFSPAHGHELPHRAHVRRIIGAGET